MKIDAAVLCATGRHFEVETLGQINDACEAVLTGDVNRGVIVFN